MKKILIINHEVVAHSYVLFPTLLFAFMVTFKNGEITFVWPFVFVYTVEKVMPFILDGRFNLSSWSGVTKFLSIVAFASGGCVALGVYLHWEWLVSVGAIGIGFGTAGLNLFPDPNRQISTLNLKRVNSIAGGVMIGDLILLGVLLIRVSLLSGVIFYAFLLFLEVLYAEIVVKRDKVPLNLRFSFDLHTFYPVLAVLMIVFTISFFKKTGEISDISWILIILAIIGLVLELHNILNQPFKLFRIWLGAVKNYLIIYTLLFAFQQNRSLWIFVVFIELMLSKPIASRVNLLFKHATINNRYYSVLVILVLSLFLTYTDWTYLIGTGVAAVSVALLGIWAKEQAPNSSASVTAKLSVFGSLCNQVVLFGTLALISQIKLANKSALLLPYIDHRQAPQYSREMFYLRVIMIALLILCGVIVVFKDRQQLFTSKHVKSKTS